MSRVLIPRDKLKLDSSEIRDKCSEGYTFLGKFLRLGVGYSRAFFPYSQANQMFEEFSADGRHDDLFPWLNGMKMEILMAYHALAGDDHIVPKIPKPNIRMYQVLKVEDLLRRLNYASTPFPVHRELIRGCFLEASQVGSELGSNGDFATLYAGISVVRRGFQVRFSTDTKEDHLRRTDKFDDIHGTN